jgi:hypothetical protein
MIPMRAAAPSAPPTRPLHSESTRTISSCCFLEYSLSGLLTVRRDKRERAAFAATQEGGEYDEEDEDDEFQAPNRTRITLAKRSLCI